MTWEVDAGPPPLPGIYAIQYCWDTEEGSFCEVGHWNGTEWYEDLPVTGRSSGPFPTEGAAQEWVDANNCSW
jgi:hypothetical protein